MVVGEQFFTSDSKTGETVDIESKIVSSGSKGAVDYYHIYLQGQLNGTPTQNLAFFELQGRFGEDLETYIAAVYLDNEPYLEKFIEKLLQKILPDPKSSASEEPLESTRPAGYEILADNTAGTAIYRRNEHGLISDVKPLPNPGWTFEIGPRSIAIRPDIRELNHATGSYQPGEYPISAQDKPTNIDSDTPAELTQSTMGESSQAGKAKPIKLTRKELLDRACIEWVTRDSHGYLGRYTRDDFLEDFQERTGEVITKDEFRRALEDAQKRGLIVNLNGRLKPKTGP